MVKREIVKQEYGGLSHHYGGDNGHGYVMVLMNIIDQVDQGDAEALTDCEGPASVFCGKRWKRSLP